MPIITRSLIALLAVFALAAPASAAERWQGDGISWEVPEGWKQEGGNQFRVATLVIPADPAPLQLAVTKFPGDVGGLHANLNRWRMQVGLPAVGPDEVEKQLTSIEAGNGVKALIADLNNADKGQRILGVILAGKEFTWFFKIMGPSEPVGAKKDAVIAFMKTVQLGEAAK